MKNHPTTQRPRRKRRAADEAAAPSAERAEAPSQSLATLRDPRVGKAARGAALAGLQRTLGNAKVGRVLARCACEDKERVSREISTPLNSDEVSMQKDGSAFFKIANIEVKVLPDKVSKNPKMKGAKTRFGLSWRGPKAKFKGGKLVSLDSPSIIVTIQTTYAPKADPAGPSEYGKGTTAEDQQAGTTSLRYHEGSHGLDYIQYMQENPPSFQGSIGMTRGEYQVAVGEFNKMISTYAAKVDAFSKQRTDCVGTTIDQAGETKKPICK